MNAASDLNSHLSKLLSNPSFQQSAPLIVVIIFPLFILSVRSYIFSCALSLAYMLSSITTALPWNWSTYTPSGRGPKSKKKSVRTRAEQLAHSADGHAVRAKDDAGYYPGLVNISGTYCFMNSTMQALASLSYLQPQIDAIHEKAEAFDVPTPVVDALQDLLHSLNSPLSYHRAIRPESMIHALSNPEPGRKSPLFSSREHQDAQELFQLVSEYIKKEAAAVDKEGHRDRGLGGLAPAPALAAQEVAKGVFDGLTANRRSCVECGYTEAVMHFAFDNWQLSVPRLAASCRLEDCLAEYTKLELLTDAMCRNCSMQATLKRLEQEADRLSEAVHDDAHASASKKKRSREARKLATKVELALREGRVEEDIKGVKMERIFSKAHTKQAMIARPPPVLALHLNRSMHHGAYATKNTCRIAFPEILDLTPFTTSGKLSTAPSLPISSTPALLPRSTTPTPAAYATPRVLYRLAAVVCHYGQHSFGHYVCFRRKPLPPTLGPARFTPPRVRHFVGCECEVCERFGQVCDADEDSPARWLRISDDSVSEVGTEAVLAEGSGAFMLYYERVAHPRPSASAESLKGSSETLRPPAVRADESATSIASSSSIKVPEVEVARHPFGARIVRSVSAVRRSQSVASGVRGASPGGSSSLSSSPPDSGASLFEGTSAESSTSTSPPDVKVEIDDEHAALPVRLSTPPPSATSEPTSPSQSTAQRSKRKSKQRRKHASSPTRISPSRTVDLRA
ncbi:cysteine proteinase [Auriscalpium vulgare]|uniref:Cysteine proteinase n=1 Tax=Auriscalpium vulgare TaxID=40419 RepID=A0ACB8RMG1_9AGAM|nr:cysteine proteinase [Auriscalpium vulgare]